MKKLLFFCGLLLFSGFLFAQINYQKGYVITNQKDTIAGLIDLRTDEMNQQQCTFQANGQSVSVIYYPGDISGYRFEADGKYYVTKKIELADAPETVFLEFLVEGMMNLYYFDAPPQAYYFFENEQGKMEKMSRKPDWEEKGRIHTDNKYIGQLTYMFRDYEPIKRKLNKTKYTQTGMMRVVEEYHDAVCTTGEECIIYKNLKPDDKGLKFKLSAYAGMQLIDYEYYQSKVVVENEHFYYVDVRERWNLFSPMIGLQLNVASPRVSKTWSTVLDLAFFQIKENSLKFEGKKIPLDAYFATLKIGAKYTIPIWDKVKPLIEGGISPYHITVYDNITNEAARYGYMFAGFYLRIGAEFPLKNNHALFVHLSGNFEGAATAVGNAMIVSQLKVGYTF